jgi:glycosidase
MDNHDVSRFLFEALGDKDALRNALVLLMTEEGIPCLYYGTEQDFSGGNDPSNREVLWPTGFPTSGDTFRHFAKLARLRAKYPALRRGDTNLVFSTAHTQAEDDAGLVAYERAGGDAGADYALVVINTNARHPSTTADGAKAMKITKPGVTLVDVLDPEAKTYAVPASGELRLIVPAQRAMILVPQP